MCAQVCLLGSGPPVISHTKFSDLSESSEDPLAIVSVACVVTVTVSTWTTVRLSREAAMHGQPLSKAVMVACAKNRGPALHILLHHTPSISEMTVTLRGALIALEN